MTQIHYRIIGNTGERADFRDSGSEAVDFIFECGIEGVLLLADRIIPLKEGVARINISQIPDGEYHPRLMCAEITIELEGIRISGNNCTPLPTSEDCIRRLLERVYSLEEHDKENEKRINELTLMIQGNGLFE